MRTKLCVALALLATLLPSGVLAQTAPGAARLNTKQTPKAGVHSDPTALAPGATLPEFIKVKKSEWDKLQSLVVELSNRLDARNKELQKANDDLAGCRKALPAVNTGGTGGS